ncbi:hypothetical protein M407DRAFT_7986 [Tulasnella calospora MUT 4182]|uniref:Uncharacterized protein n=1 Tax=Tulasnella calospora MUT 4182 TaxID=1051891 RepID=A0A0C3KXS2_9AGAM|nr:hypothetical protein M407DRAFT_7986 [Tulasnella calospora MUT 4182]
MSPRHSSRAYITENGVEERAAGTNRSDNVDQPIQTMHRFGVWQGKPHDFCNQWARVWTSDDDLRPFEGMLQVYSIPPPYETMKGKGKYYLTLGGRAISLHHMKNMGFGQANSKVRLRVVFPAAFEEGQAHFDSAPSEQMKADYFDQVFRPAAMQRTALFPNTSKLSAKTSCLPAFSGNSWGSHETSTMGQHEQGMLVTVLCRQHGIEYAHGSSAYRGWWMENFRAQSSEEVFHRHCCSCPIPHGISIPGDSPAHYIDSKETY